MHSYQEFERGIRIIWAKALIFFIQTLCAPPPGTGYNYDGPEEALFTKTANGDSKVDFPGSTLDGMDKNNSEPTKSFIDATATIDSRDQNPHSRAPVSAVFENKA